MTFFVVLLFFVVIWMSLVIFAKQEAKTLLSKYDTPLPRIKSNDIILMIRKLREINEKGIIQKEDAKDCKRIIAFLKGSLLMVPILMVLIVAVTLFI
jgi:hypothetical protein